MRGGGCTWTRDLGTGAIRKYTYKSKCKCNCNLYTSTSINTFVMCSLSRFDEPRSKSYWYRDSEVQYRGINDQSRFGGYDTTGLEVAHVDISS